MKNKGFFALLIDSLFCFIFSIVVIYAFHHYYNDGSNLVKIVLLLAIIFVIPICLGIITASISAKPTVGRKLMNNKYKHKKRSTKQS